MYAKEKISDILGRSIFKMLSRKYRIFVFLTYSLPLLLQLLFFNVAEASSAVPFFVSVRPFIGIVSPYKFPVHIKLGETALTIPRNYLQTAAFYFGGVNIVIITTYPTFLGSDENNIQSFYRSNLSELKRLISLTTTSPPVPPSQDVSENVLTQEMAAPKGGMEYGLYRGHGNASDKNFDVYFQTKSEYGKNILIACDKSEDFYENSDKYKYLPPMCHTHYFVSYDLYFECQFPKNLLEHWEDIDKNISLILQSFVDK